jgi:hypothetical protein
MNKFIAILALFRAGREVADPKKWILGQVTATMLVPPIAAAIDLSRAYGYNVPWDHDTIVTVAMLIVMLVNTVLPVICNRQVGIGRGVGEASPPVPPAESANDNPETGRTGGDPKELQDASSGGSSSGAVDRPVTPPGKTGDTFHYL